MIDSLVPVARKLTTGLIDFLAEVTQAAERNPELDICHTDQDRRWDVLWIEDLPADAGKLTPGSEDTLFSMRPPVREQAPRPPDVVGPWLDTTRPWNSHTYEPRLYGPGAVAVPGTVERTDSQDAASTADDARPPQTVVREYEEWLVAWHAWARERRRMEQAQKVYEFAEKAAKEIEQRDDEHELVFARGLVRWITPDGRTLRRHVVTEQVRPDLDRRNAIVTVRRISAALRYEDSQLFGEVEGYEHDRAEDARQALDDALEKGAPEDRCLQLLSAWIGRCTGTGATPAAALSHTHEPGLNLELSLSPPSFSVPGAKYFWQRPTSGSPGNLKILARRCRWHCRSSWSIRRLSSASGGSNRNTARLVTSWVKIRASRWMSIPSKNE